MSVMLYALGDKYSANIAMRIIETNLSDSRAPSGWPRDRTDRDALANTLWSLQWWHHQHVRDSIQKA